MNLSRFIASRLSTKSAHSYSSFIVRIATVAVAVSLIVMILAISISKGYDLSIRKKIFGFWGNIQVTDAASALGLEAKPIAIDSLFKTPLNEPFIKNVNYFALKAGLIKTDDAMYGVQLKGVMDDMDWSQFQDYLIEGQFPKDKNDVLISQELAKKLNLTIGDKVRLYFIQTPMRARALIVSGLYNTNMVELDEQLIYSSISHIQSLNGWNDDQVQGAELFVNNPDKSDEYAEYLRTKYQAYDRNIESIKQSHPEIFDWLNFLKTNQWIVLVLMALVAVVNMVSMLLVIILERSKMVGVLKALGAEHVLIQDIFLNRALRIILYGLAFGNIIGISLALVQQHFHVIKLDPEMYFLSSVPIYIDIPTIVLLNVATTVLIIFSLLLPTILIKRINPIQALRFE